MQQYIMIPELHCIVRKIAPDGDHFANFSQYNGDYMARSFRRLLDGDLTEDSYSWSTLRSTRHLVTFSTESQ